MSIDYTSANSYSLHECLQALCVNPDDAVLKDHLVLAIQQRAEAAIRLGNYRKLNEYDREDIAQEVALKILQWLEEHGYDKMNEPSGFVATTTHRHCLNYIRKNKLNRTHALSTLLEDEELNLLANLVAPPDVGEAYDTIFTPERIAAFKKVLKRIDEKHSGMAYSYLLGNLFLNGSALRYQEMANALDVPLGTIKRRVFNAKKALGEQLEWDRHSVPDRKEREIIAELQEILVEAEPALKPTFTGFNRNGAKTLVATPMISSASVAMPEPVEAVKPLTASTKTLKAPHRKGSPGPVTSLGHDIKYYRKLPECSQTLAELGAAAGLSRSSISAVEKDKLSLEHARFHNLCDALPLDNEQAWKLADKRARKILEGQSPEELLEHPTKWREAFAVYSGSKTLFGSLLYAMRIEKGKSLTELSELSDINRSQLSMYESGDTVPFPVNIERICDKLELNNAQSELLLDAARTSYTLCLDPRNITPDKKTSLGEDIKYYRSRLKMSQRQVAEAAQVTTSAISLIEKDEMNPEPVLLNKILDTLQLTPDSRFSLLDKYSGKQGDLLDDPKKWREGFAAYFRSKTLFGSLLYSLRNQKGVATENLAELLDIYPSQISQYERGNKVPRPQRIREICLKLQASDAEAEALLEAADYYQKNQRAQLASDRRHR